jgi:hypothetical protein
MNLCQRCNNAIKQVFAEVNEDSPLTLDEDMVNVIDHPRNKVVPESECEFWIHYVFNKFAHFLGWKALTDTERDGLFVKMKAEAQRLTRCLLR